MKRFTCILLISVFSLSVFSCKEDDLDWFQQNQPDPEYTLWSLLDDYPALKDFFVGLDQNEFNHKVAEFFESANTIEGLMPFLMRQMAKMLHPDQDPKTDMLGKITPFIDRIRNQDSLDKDPQYPYAGLPSNNYEAFCGFMDAVAESDAVGASNILGIADKIIRYMLATRSEAEVENDVEDMLLEIQGIDPPYTDDDNTIKMMRDGIEALCEIIIHPNESMWLDGSSNIVAPGTGGATNTGLGNVVWGIDSMLSGMSDLMVEEEVEGEELLKDIVKDLIRASLAMPGASVNGTPFTEAFKDLVFNLEDWFTYADIGGGEAPNKFDGATDYNLVIRDYPLTPAGADVDETIAPLVMDIMKNSIIIKVDGDTVGTDDGAGVISGGGITAPGTIDYTTGAIAFTLDTDPGIAPVTLDCNYDKAYSYAELGNTLKEMFPALVPLFLRADRADAIIEEGPTANEKGIYPLELLAKALYTSNVDIEGLNFEDAMYKMILYDGNGRNRITNPEASELCMLEQLLFLFAALADIGFKDRDVADLGSPMDPEAAMNYGHGHGTPTGGILTLNDAFYGMGMGQMMGFNAYDMVLDRDAIRDKPPGKHLHRSHEDFGTNSFPALGAGDLGDHPFLYDSDFPMLQLMPTNLVGDAGLPESEGGGGPVVGGVAKIPASDPPAEEDWNAYVAYNPEGKGDPSTMSWMMGLMARIMWRGHAPYYSNENMADDGTVYTPGGEVYGTCSDSSCSNITDAIYTHTYNTDYFLMKGGQVSVSLTRCENDPASPADPEPGWTTNNADIAIDTDNKEGDYSLKITSTDTMDDDGSASYNPAGTWDFSVDDGYITFWARVTGDSVNDPVSGEVYIKEEGDDDYYEWSVSFESEEWTLYQFEIAGGTLVSYGDGVMHLEAIDLIRFDANDSGNEILIDDVRLIKNDPSAIDYYAPDNDLVYLTGPYAGQEVVDETDEPVKVAILVDEGLDDTAAGTTENTVSIIHDVNGDGIGGGDDKEIGIDDGSGVIKGLIGSGPEYEYTTLDGIVSIVYEDRVLVLNCEGAAGGIKGHIYEALASHGPIDLAATDYSVGADWDDVATITYVKNMGTIDYGAQTIYMQLDEVPAGDIYASYTGTGGHLDEQLVPYGSVSDILKPPVTAGSVDIYNTLTTLVASDGSGTGVISGTGISSGTITYTGDNVAGAMSFTVDDLSILEGEAILTVNYEHGNWGRELPPVTPGTGDNEAGCVTAYEITHSNAGSARVTPADRVCATHEEAMFKNLIWLMNEKKFVLVIPLRLAVGEIMAIPVYAVAEFNGLLGVATGGKVLGFYPDSTELADGNGRWLKQGGYGRSYMPGDGRMMMCTTPAAVAMLPFMYNKFFGEGALMPGIMGANMGPMKRLAFFRDDVASLSSKEVGPESVYWADRNTMVPLFMGLVGELHRYSSKDKNPFKTMFGGLIPAITKPMAYYQADNGIDDPNNPDFIPYPRDCWKPRMAAAKNPHVMGTVSRRLEVFDPISYDYTTDDGTQTISSGDRVKVLSGYSGGPGTPMHIYAAQFDDSADLGTEDYTNTGRWRDIQSRFVDPTYNAGPPEYNIIKIDGTKVADIVDNGDGTGDFDNVVTPAAILPDSGRIVYETGEIFFFLTEDYKDASTVTINYRWDNGGGTLTVAEDESLLLVSENNYLLPTTHLPKLQNGNYVSTNDTDLSEAMAAYYAPKDNHTLLGLMFESGDPTTSESNGRVDGFLPLLCQTDVMTHALKFMQKMGAAKYGNKEGWTDGSSVDDNFVYWGARKKIFFALEQFMSNVRTQIGEAMTIERTIDRGFGVSAPEQRKIIDYEYPEWVVYSGSSEVRDEDFLIETMINDGIYGENGLANLPEDYPTDADWEDFNEMFAEVKEICTDNGVTGGEFNITEDVVDLMDAVFAGVDVTFEQTSALRHTLGALLTKYEGGTWKYYWDLYDPDTNPDDIDLTNILASSDMVGIIELFQGRYVDLLDMTAIMMYEDGFLGYLMDNMSSSYPTAEIIDDANRLLKLDPLFNAGLPDYNPVLWYDFAELMENFAPLLEEEDVEAYGDFYYTKNLADKYEDGNGLFDMYTLIGEVMSHRKSEGYLQWFNEIR